MSQRRCTAAGPPAMSRNASVLADILERDHVVDHAGAREARMVGGHAQALLQPLDRLEIELAVAPLQHAHGIEIVVLEPIDELGLEGRHLAGDAEGAVIHVTPGATGDLAKFGGGQAAMRLAVEFAQAGEGHVVEVEIEAHADGVGRHQEVDVAILIEGDLGVARARAQGAEHDGRTAALAAHELGDGVNVVDGEADDGRAPGQPRDLLVAGIRKLGEARPRDDIRRGQEVADGVAHGRGAEHQRLAQAAGVKQPLGEDVAALAVAGQLNLVDGHEIGLELERHRLHGADIIAGRGRLDLLLARDQGDGSGALALHDLVIDLARQEPERQADDADLMGQHPLDGEVGLAGIGRPENGGDAATLWASWTLGEGSGHGRPPAGPSGHQPRGAGTGRERISSESLTRPIRISFFDKITGLLFGGFSGARGRREGQEGNENGA